MRSTGLRKWLLDSLRSRWTSLETDNPRTTSGIRIKNFGKMDDRFYRGGQPRAADFRDLVGLGINTVIDLRNDPRSNEQVIVETLGMRYVNLPMSDTKYPRLAQIELFLRVVNDPMTGRFFVHCSGGRHRTGVMGAVYRLNKNLWDYDQAYSEMLTYDFYTRWGHGKLKQFVSDYYQQNNPNFSNSKQVTVRKN
jgi:protein tyrosine/serine phosphatase